MKPSIANGAIDLRTLITGVPNFPKKGILFRDISPLLRTHFSETINQMGTLLNTAQWQEIDVIGGIESRGFILGAALAATQHKGFVKIRKKGKLPPPVSTRAYGLEYGEDALEMQAGSGRMLIVDDVLATGGTLHAAAELAQETGYQVQGFACLIDLCFLNDFSWQGLRATSLLTYES
ncbi:MAG: adenine phosphoribosyltransferase [Rickettsiales bacterium]|nr:adenine phosphoribosyltransferase [Rickettsiales bacterium]